MYQLAAADACQLGHLLGQEGQQVVDADDTRERAQAVDHRQAADADVTKCTVDASGTIVTSSAAGCNAANTIRVARGDDRERPSRLWIVKFAKALNTY